MPLMAPSLGEILNMRAKESWVKQEADRLEEVKMNVLDLVLEISTISYMSKFKHLPRIFVLDILLINF